jgi:hypothetical protein
VVIHNLNVISIPITPGEADAPLIVDPNTVRPGAISPEQFKLVSRRHAKILQQPCLMQVQELTTRSPLDGLKPADHPVLKEHRRIYAFERPDQTPAYDVHGIMSNVIAAGPARCHTSSIDALPPDPGVHSDLTQNQPVAYGEVVGKPWFSGSQTHFYRRHSEDCRDANLLHRMIHAAHPLAGHEKPKSSPVAENGVKVTSNSPQFRVPADKANRTDGGTVNCPSPRRRTA